MQTTSQSYFMKLVALIFAAFVLAACSSTATDDAPATPQDTDEVEQPQQPVAPAAPVAEEPSDFNDQLQPLDANGNVLDRTFYFGYDKAVLDQADLAALRVHAQILRRNPDRSVVIEGHCDERGTREYNLALGERRADAVRNFLTAAGVSSPLQTIHRASN